MWRLIKGAKTEPTALGPNKRAKSISSQRMSLLHAACMLPLKLGKRELRQGYQMKVQKTARVSLGLEGSVTSTLKNALGTRIMTSYRGPNN